MLDCEQSLFFFLSLSALAFAMFFCGSTNSRKSPEEENWIETVRSLNYVGVLGNNRMMKLFAWLRNNLVRTCTGRHRDFSKYPFCRIQSDIYKMKNVKYYQDKKKKKWIG